MKVGLSLVGLSPRYLAQVAQEAEQAGFESVWVSEHLLFPPEIPASYPHTASGVPTVVSPDSHLFDPLVTLGYVACATKHLRLGTGVYILPLRHPLFAARGAITIDRLSGGRLILGVGVGWLEDEFRAVGEGFAVRGRRCDEIIPLLRRLWTEDVVEHRGRYYDLGPVRFEPKPIRPDGIPVEVGGAGERALLRAARLGDGYFEVGARDLDELAERISYIRSERARCGRSGAPFEITASETFAVDLETVKRCGEIGVTRVIVGAGPATPGESTLVHFARVIQRTAETLITRLS